jgi:hypothetical protein
MWRIGVLTNLPADDAEGEARITAFLQGLRNWAGLMARINWSAGIDAFGAPNSNARSLTTITSPGGPP